MNGYIALKAITLNGTEYAAGDHNDEPQSP